MTQTYSKCILWFYVDLLGTQRSGSAVWNVVGTHICLPHLPPTVPLPRFIAVFCKEKHQEDTIFSTLDYFQRFISKILIVTIFKMKEKKGRCYIFLYPLVEYRKSFWTSPFWRWKKIEVTLGAQCCCSGGSSEITSLVQPSGMKLPFERSIEIKFYFHCRCFFRLILTTQNQSWAGFSPYFKVEPGISCRPNWDRWQDYHPLEMPPSPLALCVRGN